MSAQIEQALFSTSHDDVTRSSLAISRVKQVWSIGGGKGGVGKSLIASSLAISLARSGQKVTAIDLDLGGANLHTSLGIDLPKQTLSDFLNDRVTHLNDCKTQSEIPNLTMISGAQDSIAIANLSTKEKNKLAESIRSLDADFVILDLGAGTNNNTVDFFVQSDVGIVTVIPEPTSIENAYRFIKCAFFRKLYQSPKLKEVRGLIESAMDSKNQKGIRTPSDLYREINLISPECALAMKQEIDQMNPKLILNQARTQTDIDIGFSIKSISKKYFGLEMDYIGYLDYDSAAWQAIRRKKPLMVEFPNSKLVSSIERMTQYLLKKQKLNPITD